MKIVQDFMVVLITRQNEGDSESKLKALEPSQQFSHYNELMVTRVFIQSA